MPLSPTTGDRVRGRARANEIQIRHPLAVTKEAPVPLIREGMNTPRCCAVSVVARLGATVRPVVARAPAEADTPSR